MEQTLAALAGILQKAVPTVILLVFLHLYLKAMLFKPLEKVLAERDKLTHGARQSAEHSLAEADRKTVEFETKLRDARTEVYKEQEEMRSRWLEEQNAQVAAAREAAHRQIAKAKQDIAQEAATARETLSATSSALAEEIANALLAGRAG